jgi:sugar (pentulose or hexulose) kinase
MRYLGLDVGSSTIKGAVLDIASGTVSAIAREPFPPALGGLPSGYFEVQPPAIVAAVARVLHALVAAAPDAKGVLVSGQMGGLMLVDRQGEPLTNYVSWRDQRSLVPHAGGGSCLEAARRRLTDEQFAELGNELAPGSATSLAFCLAEQDQLPAGAIPTTVADFAVAKLCGGLPAMHATQAIGLLHLPTRQWHVAAFAALGLAGLCWPRLALSWEPVGQLSMGGHHYPCYPALGDQQCALRGAGLQADELSLNISTGSQVSRRTSRLELGPYQTRPYFDGDYLNTITHLPAGRSLNVLVDLLTELARSEGIELNRVWDTIARAASAADGGGLACHPTFFAGPLGASGSITGITTENLTVGNLVHALLTNMADNYVHCAGRLWPDQSWQGIRLSGGLAKSLPVLRHLLAERFLQPLCESTAAEETLLGLLELARDAPP